MTASEARALVEMAEKYKASLNSLIGESSLARRAAVKAADDLFDEKVKVELCKLDLEELRKSGLAIRVSAFRAAGIEDLGRLYGETIDSLSEIEGIGETSAQRTLYALNKIRDRVAGNISIKLSVDERDAASDKLVLAVNRAMQYDALEKQAAPLSEHLLNGMDACSASSALLSNRLKWLFTSSAKQEQAITAVSGLAAVLFGGLTDEADALLAGVDPIRSFTADEAWGTFSKDPASFYSFLENCIALEEDSVYGTRLRFDLRFSETGGLPAELYESVYETDLDLTGLKCTLRPYQELGVKFIINQRTVLLGDEMGLGKTVEAIAAMVCLRNWGQTHFLVVCPAGVLINWCREIEKHSDLKPVKIHGGFYLNDVSRWVRSGGVAVTTYEMISRFTLPEGFTYGMLTADEAHYVKNPEALRTGALLVLRRKTDRVLFMTGTALENRLDEMHFLISCLDPDTAASIGGISSLSKASEFRSLVAPVYFRRKREDVLKELPEKIEEEIWCGMNAAEYARYYDSVMAGDFMAMRQVSWNVTDPKDSSKAVQLRDICEEAVDNGKKVIVFSFFLNTLRQAGRMLSDCRCFGPLTGSVSPKDRQAMIDGFSAEQGGAVLLSQVQAGGTGLNIQAASVIIFCEPQIKPSLETQAISRAYRMGQLNTVLVYRLLCEGSIDGEIMDLLAEKQEIFDSFADVSESGQDSLTKTSTAEMVAAERRRLEASGIES